MSLSTFSVACGLMRKGRLRRRLVVWSIWVSLSLHSHPIDRLHPWLELRTDGTNDVDDFRFRRCALDGPRSVGCSWMSVDEGSGDQGWIGTERKRRGQELARSSANHHVSPSVLSRSCD